MSFYNMLFGRNPQASMLLAVIGLKEVDVERFRDVFVHDGGKQIAIYARTGGGNREDYPQALLTGSPLFVGSEDDDFDSTYATFYFRVPEEFAGDVSGLSDVLANGLRPEFGKHLLKTLNRDPNEADKERAERQVEEVALARTAHFKANGHTFVPQDDSAMEAALKIAEANGGSLRTCWGILPLTIKVKTDFRPYPNSRDVASAAALTRVRIDYEWTIDKSYWQHCQERFAADFPITMAKIAEDVSRQREAA